MEKKDQGKDRTALWVAVISGVVAIVVALIEFKPFQSKAEDPVVVANSKSSNELSGTIVNEIDNSSIDMADITVVGRNEQYVSESNGNFHIPINDPAQKQVRIRVTKAKYRPYDHTFDLPTSSIIIKLTPQ